MLSLLALLAMLAAPGALAGQVFLTDDGNGGYYINMPASGTDELVIPDNVTSFKVYDDGGPKKTFTSYCDGYLLLTAPEGHLLRVSGRLHTSPGSLNKGFLHVYDGTSASAIELFNRSGVVNELPRKLSSTQNMFIRFNGNMSQTNYEGLELTITIVDPSAPHAINFVSVDEGGFINPPTEATPGTVVTLTASPNSGYFFNNVKIQDEYSTDSYTGNVDFTGGWYTNNTISFTMPQTEVTVTPSFDYAQYASVLFEKSGTENITIPSDMKSFNLEVGYSYDAINSDILLTATEGKILLIQGEVAPRTGLDSLYVYDGVDVNAAELLKVAARASINKNSSGQNMLIHYKELGDNPRYRTSLSVKVSVVDPNEEFVVSKDVGIYDGSINVDQSSATFNTPVTVTAIPDVGYFLNKIEVVGEDSRNPVAVTGGTWYTDNEATFAMPPENVSVNALFVNERTAGAGLSIAMPIYEPLRVSIPTGVESFELKGDDLGEGVPSKPLILTAPNEYLLQINGNDSYGYGFNVYEGDVADPVGTGAEQTPGLVIGRTLTIVNLSSGDCPYSIDVTLIQNEEHAITVAAANEQGAVTISPVSGLAFAGDTITVTGVPNEGYVFNGIKVKEENENGSELFEVIDGVWYNGEAKFVMPMKDVYLEPIFTEIGDDFQIKIPKTDTLRVTVPEGITWLDIFDDGGAGGNYSNNADGTLILTAPEGYVLATGNCIETEENKDSLYIYDGAEADSRVLAKIAGDVCIDYEDEIISSGRSLTFHFKSDAENTYSGVGMYVTVMKKSGSSAVAIYEAGGYKTARIDGMYAGEDAVALDEDIQVGDVYLDRTFTPGAFSTIVLPFDVNAANISGLEEVIAFDGVKEVNGEYQVEMVRVWCLDDAEDPVCQTLDVDLKAYTPYMIKTHQEKLYFPEYLTLKKTEEAEVSSGEWLFKGTNVFRTWAKGDPDLGRVYGFAAEQKDGAEIGDFVKLGAGARIRPFRAYMEHVNPSPAPVPFGAPAASAELPEKIKVVIIDKDKETGDDQTTVIGVLNTRTGEFKMERSYDLKGRKLNTKPTTRGAYYGKRKILK